MGKGEHIKDKTLELHARVGFGCNSLSVLVNVLDLLLGNVVFELRGKRGHAFQKFGGEEVVGNVGGTECEFAISLALFRELLRDLRVLDHTILAIADADNANRLLRGRFAHNLNTTVGSLGHRVTNKDGISNTSKTVVDTVTVRVENAAFLQ